MAVNRLTPISI